MYVSSEYIIDVLKKRRSQQNKIKSTWELTLRVSSLGVFVIEFERYSVADPQTLINWIIHNNM